MWYINAKILVDAAVEHGILAEQDDRIAVYREAGNPRDENPEGWYLEDREELALELMRSEEGQQLLINELAARNVTLKLVPEEDFLIDANTPCTD